MRRTAFQGFGVRAEARLTFGSTDHHPRRLNPPDLVDIVPEVVPGYPDRIQPRTEEAATILRNRTLSNFYNERPQWLSDAHRDLDAAVARSLRLAGGYLGGGRAGEAA